MEYTVNTTEECGNWILALNDHEKVDVLASIKLLKTLGHHLGFPHSSKINGSKYSHMRELRIQHKGKPYRILYAFDPNREALLLVGGSKVGDDRWYKKNIPIADRLYEEHLNDMGKGDNHG